VGSTKDAFRPQAHGVSGSHYNSRSQATERLQYCIHHYLTPTTSKNLRKLQTLHSQQM